MATALYRRYRPESFADVIGQEHVTEPLMQALRTGRVNHAYLFSGPRGCGKTTSARILARCLNCEQGPTPTPCGVCESCVALARGGSGSVDVIEIDAASHGGVDDARELRERASYGPAQSRYKIYIIDEAHMVTPQGFNALLKIVEEPPEHVKFVFATTEPEKVIGTIRSRTHHYPFRLVPPAQLTAYMERLLEAEGVPAAPGVLSFVVRAGGGSVRDSLSVLDQLIAGSGPEGLTYDGAVSLLGFTDAELLDAVVDAFAASDAAAVFRQIDKVIESGHDPRRFIEDLLERLRDLIIVAAIQDGAGQVLRGLSEDQLERMRVQQAQFGPGALSRAADIVNAGLTELTGANSPRLQLELICARILLPGVSGEQGYAARLDRLERRLEVGGVPSAVAASGGPPARAQQAGPVPGGAAQAAGPAPAPQTPAPTAQAPAPAAAATPEGPGAASARTAWPAPQVSGAGPSGPHRAAAPDPAGARSVTALPPTPAAQPAAPVASGDEPGRTGGMDTDAIRRAWPEVLGRIFSMRRATWTFVSQHAQVLSYDGKTLTLGIGTVGLTNTFRQGNHAELVRQALIDELGVDAVVDGVPAPVDGAGPPRDAGPAGGAGPTAGAGPTGGHPPQADPTSSGPAPGRPPVSGAGATATRASSGPSAVGGTPGPVASRTVLQHNSGWGSSPTSAAPDWAAATSTAPPAWAADPAVAADSASTTGRDASRDTADFRGPRGAAAPAKAPTAPEAPRASVPDARRPPGVATRGARVVRESFAQAKAGSVGDRQATAPPVATDDSAVSVDDEDIEHSSDVGRSVIERVLGGRVLEEREE